MVMARDTLMGAPKTLNAPEALLAGTTIDGPNEMILWTLTPGLPIPVLYHI